MRRVACGPIWAGFGNRLALLLLLMAVAGCGPGQTRVSGQVRYQGTPLPGGRLTFRPADPRQNAVSADLDDQGHYEAMLPPGAVQVSVDNRHLKPPAQTLVGLPSALPLSTEAKKKLGSAKPPPSRPKTGEGPPGKYRMIPRKYYEIETSGLDFTVERGTQTHDFDLTK